MEVDGHGVADFSVRQAILAETGLWGWHVPATGPALLKTLIQIREKLDLKVLRVSGIAAIKNKAPGILAVGTRAEIELLVELAEDAGLDSLAESVPSNQYAPLDFANFSHRPSREKRTDDIPPGREPLKLASTDFVSLGSFQLSWRWTEPQYAVFRPESLALIRPLSEAKAFDAWRRSNPFFDESFQTNFSFSNEHFPEMERLDLTSGNLDVREWLNERLPDPNEELIISWDQDTAVLVSTQLFVAYWDDFYYPGSDDLVTWPMNEAWCLLLHHEEQLLFGRRR